MTRYLLPSITALALLLATPVGAEGEGPDIGRPTDSAAAEPAAHFPHAGDTIPLPAALQSGAGANVISFDLRELPAKTYGDEDFDLAPHVRASSGLPVSLGSLTPAVCVVDNETSVRILGAGECRIQARQDGIDAAGMRVTDAAEPASRVIPIARAPLTVRTYSITKTYGERLTVDDFMFSVATVVGNDRIGIATIETAGAAASAPPSERYMIVLTLSDPEGRLADNYEVIEDFGYVTVQPARMAAGPEL